MSAFILITPPSAINTLTSTLARIRQTTTMRFTYMFSQWNRDRPNHQHCRNQRKNLWQIRWYHDLCRAFLTGPYRSRRRSWNVIEQRISGAVLVEDPKSPAYDGACKCLNRNEQHFKKTVEKQSYKACGYMRVSDGLLTVRDQRNQSMSAERKGTHQVVRQVLKYPILATNHDMP